MLSDKVVARIVKERNAGNTRTSIADGLNVDRRCYGPGWEKVVSGHGENGGEFGGGENACTVLISRVSRQAQLLSSNLVQVDDLIDFAKEAGGDCMGDEPAPTGQKEYWHDKRLAPAPTVSSPAEQSTGHPANPLVTPAQPRAYRNPRHPIASFVIVVIAIILASVGLLSRDRGAGRCRSHRSDSPTARNRRPPF